MERSGEKPREEVASRGFFASGVNARLRPVEPSDLEDIMALERVSFSSPWSAGYFLREQRTSSARSLLAIVEGKTVGYVIFWVLPGAMDIHNLAVHPAYRRLGIGRALLEAVIGEARSQALGRVTLEVRKSNEAAQRLYHSVGFVIQGVRKGYYSDDGEDALIMTLDLAG